MHLTYTWRARDGFSEVEISKLSLERERAEDSKSKTERESVLGRWSGTS